MTHYLTLPQIILIHKRIIASTGGSYGIRDQSSLESAVAQPRLTFEGKDLYPLLIEKASALCYSIINNHPFVDGNKRTGHATMEVFLVLNGYQIKASVDEQEKIILQVASGGMQRSGLRDWLEGHIVKFGNGH
jgi:death-on-curing protein